jgi:hypothetical protein
VSSADLADIPLLHQVSQVTSARAEATLQANDMPHTLGFG